MKSTGLAGSTAGTLILALLFIRGVGFNATPRTEAGAQPERTEDQRAQSQELNPAASSREEDGPWQASRRYFAGRPGGDCPPLPAKPESRNVASPSDANRLSQQTGHSPDKAERAHSSLWCIPSGVRVGAMIAIVPDPVHSHLSLIFDRTIEALQLSAGAMNYVVDRYWLPWQPDPNSQESSARQAQPGLLLFRWDGSSDDNQPEVLYVFLVSDTSTAGINGEQFRHAVDYVQQLSVARLSTTQCGAEDRVWIMGPTFSGSLASLRQLTASDGKFSPSKRWPYFSAYSGTVSSSSAIASQNLPPVTAGISSGCTASGQQAGNESVGRAKTAPVAALTRAKTSGGSSIPRLAFSSLISASEGVVSTFLMQLKKNGDIRCDSSHQVEVAILSEAATTYGGATSKTQGDCVYTSFRFPREISSLRNASAAIEPRAASSAQSGGSGLLSGYLPFSLADRQPNSSDEPPNFARGQGPLSQEAVLMKYAAELRRGHYKYVGIIATNVLDVLFLAKFLRSACPDVRLFTFNADLLFERDLDNAPYIGTLSLSTYPLISRSPDWINQQPLLPRLPFADQYEEGQYNASLLVMRAALAPSEFKLPFYEVGAQFVPRESGVAAQPRNLPVWVTTVGTGGYWPVEILPSVPESGDLQGNDLGNGETNAVSNAHLDSRDFSPSWRTLALLLSGLAFLQVIVVCAASPVGSQLREFSVVNAAPAQRFFFINVASASLAFTLAILAAPAWKFGMTAGRYVPIIAVVAALAAAVLAIASLYLALVLKKVADETGLKRSPRWSMAFSALAWAAAGLGAWFWWYLLGDDSSHYGFFFGYRAVNLATGVSPLAPMLLLVSAVFLWSIFDIWRLRFDDRVRPRLNTVNDLPGARAEAGVAKSINKYFLSPKYMAAFFVVFVAWLFTLQPGHPFQLFEKNMFGVIYEIVFCCVVALMLATGLRLSQTWTRFHALLQDLERSPIRHAFSRLKERGWSPIWQAGGQQQEWTYMVRSFEVMQQIRTCNKQAQFVLCHDITSALDKRDEIRKEMSSAIAGHSMTTLGKLQKLYSELQGCLAVVLYDAWAALQPYWNARSDELEEDDAEDEKVASVNRRNNEPDPELKEARRLEEYVALRYVAFIRGTLAHLRLWLILEAAVFSLVLLSLNVYSFEPHRSLIWSFTAIFVFIGVSAIQVLIQAHRDPIISRITGTQPNKLELQFFVRLATLGVVPLLTLLATHFPSLGRYLLSLLQPGMEALK